MTDSYFEGPTLDDVMKLVIEEIFLKGLQINPSKGRCSELIGLLLKIENPRARFSRTETKGKPFSGLGELCWYLAKTNDLEFISYYLSKYKNSADGNIIYGGYGPRFFNWKRVNQVAQVISILRKNPHSRKAVIQLFDAKDITEKHNDVPCTCTMQFLLRDNLLHLITYMRSNDVFIGLPHDVFCFTMLQEIIARSLLVDVGYYKHSVGSMHLYDRDRGDAKKFLDEGWQPTDIAMPLMPLGDPWPSIKVLLKAEKYIRLGKGINFDKFINLDPYWVDLIRLLLIFRKFKDNDEKKIHEIRTEMYSNVYNSFIDNKLRQV